MEQALPNFVKSCLDLKKQIFKTEISQMKKMNLREISTACGGQLVSGKDIIITSIVTDSRKAAAGCLFAAIKGERTDGHNFIKTAAQQGAAAVLCEKARIGRLISSTARANTTICRRISAVMLNRFRQHAARQRETAAIPTRI